MTAIAPSIQKQLTREMHSFWEAATPIVKECSGESTHILANKAVESHKMFPSCIYMAETISEQAQSWVSAMCRFTGIFIGVDFWSLQT